MPRKYSGKGRFQKPIGRSDGGLWGRGERRVRRGSALPRRSQCPRLQGGRLGEVPDMPGQSQVGCVHLVVMTRRVPVGPRTHTARIAHPHARTHSPRPAYPLPSSHPLRPLPPPSLDPSGLILPQFTPLLLPPRIIYKHPIPLPLFLFLHHSHSLFTSLSPLQN